MSLTMTSHLEGGDEPTAALIFQLHLQDLEDLRNNSKGKGRENQPGDDEYAFDMYKQELERCVDVLADRRMTQSIAHAVQSDGSVLSAAFEAEATAIRDRELAARLASGTDQTTIQPSLPSADEASPMDDEMLAKLAALYVSGVEVPLPVSVYEESDDEEAGPSSYTHTRVKIGEDRVCEVCREPAKFYDVARLPCRHEYCRDCLEEAFRSCIGDESLFPPRCCRQPIPLADVRIFLTPELTQRFTERKRELEATDRTYCCSPSCSVFIPSEAIENEVATCQNYYKRTCTICKSAAHPGDCPEDEPLQQLLEFAEHNGWQRCYSC